MKKKETIPEERHETIRQELMLLLQQGEFTVGDLSKEIHKSEKEISDHLSHLKKASRLRIIPAECLQCGYVFESREKIKKPGKCPACRSTHIDEPLYTVPDS